jgi:hypothetical protein
MILKKPTMRSIFEGICSKNLKDVHCEIYGSREVKALEGLPRRLKPAATNNGGAEEKPPVHDPYPGACTGEVIDRLFHHRAGSGRGDHPCISRKVSFGDLWPERLPFTEAFLYLFVG